jgi:rod shape-determining protein MreC
VALSRRIGRSRFTLVLLVLTSVTLLTLDFRGFAPLEQARSSVLSVFAPVGDGATNLFRPVGNFWHGAFSYDDLQRENDGLRSQIDELEGQVTTGEVAKQTNQELLAQAKLPFVGDLQTVRARVTSGAVANFDDTVEISKGSSDGIAKGMPVVTGTGLVGTVVQVSDSRAVVRLITNTSFQVGVNVLGTASNGVARGQGTDQRLRAVMDITAQAQPGQILVTRAVPGGLFPADLPVGTVASVHGDDGSLERSVDVDLLANLHDLSYVSVVLWSGR